MKGVAIFLTEEEATEFGYQLDLLPDGPKIAWNIWSRYDHPEVIWYDGQNAVGVLDYLVKEYLSVEDGLGKYPWLFL